MRSGRRLLALAALGAAGLLAALSISTSLALFSSTGGQQINSFAAGTVTLWSCSGSGCTPTPETSASASTCTPTESTPCEYTILYVGSLRAWIGMNVSAIGLTPAQFTVQDSYSDTFGDGPTQPQVVDDGSQPDGFTDTFTITLTTSGSSGTPGSVTLSAQAVQADNNSLPSPLIGPVNWG
jgi:hypothetical protein